MDLIFSESKFVQMQGETNNQRLVLVMDLRRREKIIDAMYKWESRKDIRSFEKKGLICGGLISSLVDEILGPNSSERGADSFFCPRRNVGWFSKVSSWVHFVLKQKAI